jgi:hypothetical protein
MLQALALVALTSLIVWRVDKARRAHEGTRALTTDVSMGFVLWLLVGVGAMASMFTALGPLVFLPVTAMLVWVAAARCSDTPALWGMASGVGLALVAAFVLLHGDSWNVGSATRVMMLVLGIALSAGGAFMARWSSRR